DNVGYREASAATAQAATLVHTQSPTTTLVTSDRAQGSVYGLAVTFTATVRAVGPAAGTPTGSVQLWVDGAAFGPARALDGGTASITTAGLGAGEYAVTVVYTSDSASFGVSEGSL